MARGAGTVLPRALEAQDCLRQRYQGLHDKWQAYIADVAPLASSVKKQQVEHEFFDHAGGKFEKQIVTVPAYERDDLDAWDQLIMKWLCPTFTIQDCIARTCE